MPCALSRVRLFADHVQERADRPDLRLDVGNGAALCGRHHTLKSAAARAERFGLSARDLGLTLAPQQEPQAEPRPNLNLAWPVDYCVRAGGVEPVPK